MAMFHLASSLIYGDLCMYETELKKLGEFRILGEILSCGKSGEFFRIGWMTNMIAQCTALPAQMHNTSHLGCHLKILYCIAGGNKEHS